MIVSRVVRPGPKLATADLVERHHPGRRPGRRRRVHRRGLCGDGLAAGPPGRHRGQVGPPAPDRRNRQPAPDGPVRPVIVLDGGTQCPLAARGYSRDGKKGKPQIEYGLLTDPHGRPVSVRVFPGNTGDPTAFVEAVSVVRNTFGLRNMVMVGDRGMITSARIDNLKQLPVRTGSRG